MIADKLVRLALLDRAHKQIKTSGAGGAIALLEELMRDRQEHTNCSTKNGDGNAQG